jgi:mannose-6-phosphate isomerase-like protein (cupin superfamily)
MQGTSWKCLNATREMEGEFTFHIGDRSIPATLGTFVHIPKGALHKFQNTGTEVFSLAQVLK